MLRDELPRRISTNHGSYAPAELAAIYHDVLHSGQELGVPVPRLASYRRDIDLMVTEGAR
jgi:hypothetical protein